MSKSGEKHLVCPVSMCSHEVCPTLQSAHMTERLKTQAALIPRGWDRSEWVLPARHIRCHPGDLPWSPGKGPG